MNLAFSFKFVCLHSLSLLPTITRVYKEFGPINLSCLRFPLVNLIDQPSTNLNKQLQTTSVYLNMEKSFDRIWHGDLLLKVLKLNLSLHLIKITYSFQTNRTFTAKTDDQYSLPTQCKPKFHKIHIVAHTIPNFHQQHSYQHIERPRFNFTQTKL